MLTKKLKNELTNLYSEFATLEDIIYEITESLKEEKCGLKELRIKILTRTLERIRIAIKEFCKKNGIVTDEIFEESLTDGFAFTYWFNSDHTTETFNI